MKLEVGMYYRDKWGKIGKILSCGGNLSLFDTKEEKDLWEYEEDKYITRGNIKKASHNLIDVIQVGDYVNGCYVSNKRASVNEHLGGHPKGIGIIKCNAYFNQGNYNDCKFVWIEENAIESIVTKEQFKSVEKVSD